MINSTIIEVDSLHRVVLPPMVRKSDAFRSCTSIDITPSPKTGTLIITPSQPRCTLCQGNHARFYKKVMAYLCDDCIAIAQGKKIEKTFTAFHMRKLGDFYRIVLPVEYLSLLGLNSIVSSDGRKRFIELFKGADENTYHLRAISNKCRICGSNESVVINENLFGVPLCQLCTQLIRNTKQEDGEE